MRRLLFSLVYAGMIANVLTASLRSKAFAWEITSHESWQWGCLDDEQEVASGFVFPGSVQDRPSWLLDE